MCHYTFRLTAPTLITIGLAYTLIHVAEGYNEEQHRRQKATWGYNEKSSHLAITAFSE